MAFYIQCILFIIPRNHIQWINNRNNLSRASNRDEVWFGTSVAKKRKLTTTPVVGIETERLVTKISLNYKNNCYL